MCIFLLFCLKKDHIYCKINYFSVFFQTQGNIFNETYTRVGFLKLIPELICISS